MKIKMSRASFLRTWAILEKHISAQSMRKGVGYIRLTADESGLSMGVSSVFSGMTVQCDEDVEIIEPGGIVLFGKTLTQVVHNLPTGDIVLQGGEDGCGELISGHASIRFPVAPSQHFCSLFPGEYAPLYTVPSGALCRLLRQGSASSIPGDEFPRYLGATCLHVDGVGLKAASTDGRRLALASLDGDYPEGSEALLIDTREIRHLVRALSFLPECPVDVSCSQEYVRFEGDRFLAWIKRTGGGFPNYANIVRRGTPGTTLTVARGELKAALELLGLCSRWAGGYDLCLLGLQEGDRLYLQAAHHDVSGKVTLPAAVTGKPLHLALNSGFLIGALGYMQSEKITLEFDEPDSAVYITEDGLLFMVMPLRITEQDRLDVLLADMAGAGAEA